MLLRHGGCLGANGAPLAAEDHEHVRLQAVLVHGLEVKGLGAAMAVDEEFVKVPDEVVSGADATAAALLRWQLLFQEPAHARDTLSVTPFLQSPHCKNIVRRLRVLQQLIT